MFNYYDKLKNSHDQVIISNYIQEYISLNAPKIKVYKAETNTSEIDEIYGQAIGTQVYLPYFEIRAIYQIQPFLEELKLQGLVETQEDTQFILHLDTMLETIQNIKNLHLCDIFLTYEGIENCTIQKINNSLIIKKDGIVFEEIELNSTIESLVNYLSSLENFLCSFEGDSSLESLKIVNFEEVECNNLAVNFYCKNKKFDTISNVIDNGDLIVDHNGQLYEVVESKLNNQYLWDYNVFILTCSVKNVQGVILPHNGLDEIYNQLRSKLKKVYYQYDRNS